MIPAPFHALNPYTHGASRLGPGRDGKREFEDFASTSGRGGGPESGMAVPHVLSMQAVVGTAWRTFWHGRYDEAIRDSQANADAMRNDPFIMRLVEENKLAVCSLKVSVEVDNERDPWQKAMKDSLKQQWDAIPYATDLHWYLNEAEWYGRYAAQFSWTWKMMDLPALPKGGGLAGSPFLPGSAANPNRGAIDAAAQAGAPSTGPQGSLAGLSNPGTSREKRRVLAMKWHMPYEGDKIGYDYDGCPYVLINTVAQARLEKQGAPLGVLPDLNAKSMEYGYTTAGGRALFLRTPSWRQRFAIHRGKILDSPFMDAEKGDQIHGIGIRSVIYWYWWLRDEFLSNVADWCARTGLGVRVWYYDSGNAQSEAAANKAAREQMDKTNILIAREPGSDAKGVEFVDTTGSGADLLLRIVQYIDEQIMLYIVGQSMSTGSDPSGGLGGTGRSDFAKSTKFQRTKLNAAKYSDTCTYDILNVMKQHSFPADLQEIPCRLVFHADVPDPKEFLESVKTFCDLGGTVIEDQARGVTGLSAPKEGDRVLGGQQPLPPGVGGGGVPTDGAEAGGKNDAPNEHNGEGSPATPGKPAGGVGVGIFQGDGQVQPLDSIRAAAQTASKLRMAHQEKHDRELEAEIERRTTAAKSRYDAAPGEDESAPLGEGWATIGGRKEGGKKHVGGFAVHFNSEGIITNGGTPAMHGKKLTDAMKALQQLDADEKKEPKEEKPEHAVPQVAPASAAQQPPLPSAEPKPAQQPPAPQSAPAKTAPLAKGSIVNMSDIRQRMPGASEAQIGAAMERLHAAGAIQLFGDTDPSSDQFKQVGGVMIGSQGISAASPLRDISDAELNNALSATEPKPAAQAAPAATPPAPQPQAAAAPTPAPEAAAKPAPKPATKPPKPAAPPKPFTRTNLPKVDDMISYYDGEGGGSGANATEIAGKVYGVDPHSGDIRVKSRTGSMVNIPPEAARPYVKVAPATPKPEVPPAESPQVQAQDGEVQTQKPAQSAAAPAAEPQVAAPGQPAAPTAAKQPARSPAEAKTLFDSMLKSNTGIPQQAEMAASNFAKRDTPEWDDYVQTAAAKLHAFTLAEPNLTPAILANKAKEVASNAIKDVLRKGSTQKRGGGRVKQLGEDSTGKQTDVEAGKHVGTQGESEAPKRPDEVASRNESDQGIHKAIAKLDPRDQDIAKGIMAGETSMAIAARLGVAKSTVSKALAKMQEAFASFKDDYAKRLLDKIRYAIAELAGHMRYTADASGHEHVGAGSPEGGQFTGRGDGQSPDEMAQKLQSGAGGLAPQQAASGAPARPAADHAQAHTAWMTRGQSRDAKRASLETLKEHAETSPATTETRDKLTEADLHFYTSDEGRSHEALSAAVDAHLAATAQHYAGVLSSLTEAGAPAKAVASVKAAAEKAQAAIGSKASDYLTLAQKHQAAQAAVAALAAEEQPEGPEEPEPKESPDEPEEPDEPDLPDEPAEPDESQYDDPAEFAQVHAEWQTANAVWAKESDQLTNAHTAAMKQYEKAHKEWQKASAAVEKENDRATAAWEKEAAKWEKDHDRWEVRKEKADDVAEKVGEKLNDSYAALIETDEAQHEKVFTAAHAAADDVDAAIQNEEDTDQEPEEPEEPEEDDGEDAE